MLCIFYQNKILKEGDIKDRNFKTFKKSLEAMNYPNISNFTSFNAVVLIAS